MSTMYPGSLIHPCKCSPVILRYKILLRSIAFILKAAANDLFYFSIMYIDTRTKSHLSPRLIRLFHFCIFLLPILLNIRRYHLFYHRTDYKPSPLIDLLLRICRITIHVLQLNIKKAEMLLLCYILVTTTKKQKRSSLLWLL